MRTRLAIIIILVQLLLIIAGLDLSISFSKAYIKSKLVYKKEFVRQIHSQVYEKKDYTYNFALNVEIAKYNAWLIQMQYLHENGFKLWIPNEIQNEIPYSR